MNKKKLEEKMSLLESKYFDLVWLARKDKMEFLEQERYDILKIMKDIEDKYPEEVKALIECDSNWTHGFNSGMLACLRLILGLMSRSKVENELAEEEFPFLDT